jgi:hypothetical protein
MRISTFRVVNYKSFADSGEIRFKSGFNVIVGRNNVGKTALAEAVGLHSLVDKPPRSLKTVPTPGAPQDSSSEAEVSIRVEANELSELLINELPSFYVPTSPDQMDASETWLRAVLSEGVTVDAVFSNRSVLSAQLPYRDMTFPMAYLHYTMDSSGKPTSLGLVHGKPSDKLTLAEGLVGKFFERLYIFSAVRFDIDENPIGTNRGLTPNASNLVQVLDLLSRNPIRWQRYFRIVKTVLPELEAVTFIPSDQGGGRVRALLWNINPSTEREDLAVSLSESGTGVGQVLAIL